MVDNKDLTVNFLPSPTWNRLGVNRAKSEIFPLTVGTVFLFKKK